MRFFNLVKKHNAVRASLEKYAKILYAEACLIGGVALDNPAELCELVSELMI